MSGPITAIVKAISDDLAQCRAALSKAPLAGGAIEVGAWTVAEFHAPPRVVFEPAKWDISYDQRASQGLAYPGADLMQATEARQFAARMLTYKFHVWGVANAGPGATQDPIADLEACDDLLNDLQRSVFRVAEGIALFAGGEYMTSDNPKATTIVPYGCYTFGFVAIPIPIQDLLLQPASDTTTPVGFEISAETETPTEPATLIDYP